MLVVVLSVGITAFLVRMSTEREFEQYISECDSIYINHLQHYLVNYYAANNGWEGVQSQLDNQVGMADERLVLADAKGLILADTKREWLGQNVVDFGLNESFTISSDGMLVGRVYSIIYGEAACVNMVGNRCTGKAVLADAELNFIGRVNDYLWIAGIVGAAVALFLGLVLTRQIILPLLNLKQGAQQVASGNLGFRVKVDARDEFGEVARSFNSMAESLHKIEQSRRQLTADIAHELRTPLTVIDGTVQGIMDGIFQPDEEHLKWIKDQADLLASLINDLRDLSLVESGQLKLNTISLNIAEFIISRISQWTLKVEEKGIQFKYDIPDKTLEIQADPIRLEQIINNLINNAIRHTEQDGEINITLVKAEAEIDAEPGVVLTVADNGEGISPQHLEHIFERFYRIQSSRSKGGKETGLGLAIVKRMVEAHKGKIWVESEPGKGSQFHIYIPVDSHHI